MSKNKFSMCFPTLRAMAKLEKLTGENLNFAQIVNAAFLQGEPCGTLSGTPRKIADLIRWDQKTVERLYRKMLELPDGGNPALRALPAASEGEVKFYSEAAANSKQESDKRQTT